MIRGDLGNIGRVTLKPHNFRPDGCIWKISSPNERAGIQAHFWLFVNHFYMCARDSGRLKIICLSGNTGHQQVILDNKICQYSRVGDGLFWLIFIPFSEESKDI